MGKRIVHCLLFMALFALPCAADANMIKAYFNDFAVTGVRNENEMRSGLKALLASRLGGALILGVDTPAEADIIISGSYVEFGGIFSMDAVAKNGAGLVLTRAFVQGQGKGELIPAIEKMARELVGEVRKAYLPPSAPQAAASSR